MTLPAFARLGLVAGVALSVVMFAPPLLFGPRTDWMEWGEVVGYTAMVLAMSAVFFAVRRERDRRGGTIAFGPAFATGIGTAFVGAAFFGLATWVFYAAMGDALPDAIMAFYAQQIRDAGLDGAAITRRLAELEGMRAFFYNRPLQGAVMFATVFLIGVVLSLVAAIALRRATPMVPRAA